MGVVFAPLLILTLFCAPAIAILTTKGATLTSRVAFAILSLAAVFTLFGLEIYVARSGDSQALGSATSDILSFSYTASLVLPVCTWLLFKAVNLSRISVARVARENDIDSLRVRSLRKSVHAAIILCAILLSLPGTLNTSADALAMFLLIAFAVHVWAAIAMGRLATEINRNGFLWGWVAAVVPVFGLTFAYLIVGVGSAKYVR